MDIKDKARIFSIAAHSAVNQKRKYTNEPYWIHPEEVALLVSQSQHTDEMIAAAWLHDVVEDTEVDVTTIWNEFGVVVASYVHWLTNPSKQQDGNRAIRKEIDRKFIANAPAEVKTIKLADLISNSKTIVEHDPDFAHVYMKEKRLLLEVLTQGDEILYKQAMSIVENFFQKQNARK